MQRRYIETWGLIGLFCLTTALSGTAGAQEADVPATETPVETAPVEADELTAVEILAGIEQARESFPDTFLVVGWSERTVENTENTPSMPTSGYSRRIGRVYVSPAGARTESWELPDSYDGSSESDALQQYMGTHPPDDVWFWLDGKLIRFEQVVDGRYERKTSEFSGSFRSDILDTLVGEQPEFNSPTVLEPREGVAGDELVGLEATSSGFVAHPAFPTMQMTTTRRVYVNPAKGFVVESSAMERAAENSENVPDTQPADVPLTKEVSPVVRYAQTADGHWYRSELVEERRLPDGRSLSESRYRLSVDTTAAMPDEVFDPEAFARTVELVEPAQDEELNVLGPKSAE